MITLEDIEGLKQALIAHEKGEPWEVRHMDVAEWNNSNPDHAPSGDLETYRYRAKPKPATRDWCKPEDVPGPICWIRNKGSRTHFLIIAVSESGIVCASSNNGTNLFAWERLPTGIPNEYSTDRITWHPCKVTEGV